MRHVGTNKSECVDCGYLLERTHLHDGCRIVVCSACRRSSCYLGVFPCDAKDAGPIQGDVAEVLENEHRDFASAYWYEVHKGASGNG